MYILTEASSFIAACIVSSPPRNGTKHFGVLNGAGRLVGYGVIFLVSSIPASRSSWTSSALIFAAFLCLTLLKYQELLVFAAPYFEDRYLATLPTIGPFDIWQPMGGGYMTLWPRLVSVLIAQFANIAHTPLLLTLYSIALKAGACTTIVIFLVQFLGLPRWFALLTGLAALAMQAAPFAIDTLLINSMWNMFVIAILGLIALPTLSTASKLLVLIFCIITISSSAGCVLLAVVSSVMLLCALLARQSDFDLSFSVGDFAIYSITILLVAAYFAFGVDYEMLDVSSMFQQPISLVSRIDTALIIAFERAFVEGSLGRMARELVMQSDHRQVIAVIGTAILVFSVAGAALRGIRQSMLRYPCTLVSILAGTLTIAVMVSYSGRYVDGYGGPQHYYVPAMLILVVVSASLARVSPKLAAALLVVYLGTAAINWEVIRNVPVIGDPRTNHETYQHLADAFLRGECTIATPCVVDTPPWAGAFSISLSDGR